MQLTRVSLLFICLLSFSIVLQSSLTHELPLSYDVWYHLQISRNFTHGQFLWDAGSFGPEGRPNTYPPLFHGFTALLHLLTGLPFETLARFLPPFLFTLFIYTFYILVKEVTTEKIALVSCLFASVSPILLDRGMSYTPEALSFTFINCGLVFYLRGRIKTAGIMGGLLLLTHGLSSAAFFSVLLIFSAASFAFIKEDRWSYLKHFTLVSALSLLIFAFWGLRSAPTHIPYGGEYPLALYPSKLGWIQVFLAFLGFTFLSKDKKTLFILSFAGSVFILTRNPISLPYRFVEFLALPVCMLAARGIYCIKMNTTLTLKKVNVSLIILFSLAFINGSWSVEKYKPMVTEGEKTSFLWLNETSVEGLTIMTQWRTAPILAYFSERPPLKGAFEMGALNLRERTEDTQLFYTTYAEDLISKYAVSYVYYGLEEAKYGHEEPPFDKVYSTRHTAFYHR